MTALLHMLYFLMSIFMIVQFMLRDTINNQDSELNSLSQQVASLAEALGLEQQKSFSLEGTIKDLDVSLGEVTAKSEMQSNLIATLTQKTREQSENIDNFEAQVAALLSEKNDNIPYDDWTPTDIKVNVQGLSTTHTRVVKKDFSAGSILLLPGNPICSDPILIQVKDEVPQRPSFEVIHTFTK